MEDRDRVAAMGPDHMVGVSAAQLVALSVEWEMRSEAHLEADQAKADPALAPLAPLAQALAASAMRVVRQQVRRATASPATTRAKAHLDPLEESSVVRQVQSVALSGP